MRLKRRREQGLADALSRRGHHSRIAAARRHQRRRVRATLGNVLTAQSAAWWSSASPRSSIVSAIIRVVRARLLRFRACELRAATNPQSGFNAFEAVLLRGVNYHRRTGDRDVPVRKCTIRAALLQINSRGWGSGWCEVAGTDCRCVASICDRIRRPQCHCFILTL